MSDADLGWLFKSDPKELDDQVLTKCIATGKQVFYSVRYIFCNNNNLVLIILCACSYCAIITEDALSKIRTRGDSVFH